MDISVSCTLEGRDLAVVKSIININNIFGDLNLTYVEDVNASQVLFAKQTLNGDEVYYAEDLQAKRKYHIQPNLNPKTVRAMFEFLGNSMKITSLEKNTQAAEIANIHQFILQHSSKESLQTLSIFHNDFQLLIDQSRQQVYASVALTDELLKSLASHSIANIKFKYIDTDIEHDFEHQMALANFKWNLGYFQEEHLIIDAYRENNQLFKLLAWPNFGAYKFDQEFIKLCSLLRNQPKSYHTLVDVSGYPESSINKLLNATLMVGMVDTKMAEQPVKQTDNKHDSHFIHSLKKFFGFS